MVIYRHIFSVLFFLFVSMIFALLCDVMFGTNPGGETCNYSIWKEGGIYQWLWENKAPCVFSFEYYVSIYLFVFPLYLIYDYIRRKIIGKNPGIFLRAGEVGLWFLLHWGSVIYLTISEYRAFNPIMIWTSFLGSVLFILPLFIIALLTKFLADKTVAKLLLGIVIFYILLILVAISYGK